MIKYINNKTYSTEGATFIAEVQHNKPEDDDYLLERLYRKRTGEFFLHGTGGPSTRYAKPQGKNVWIKDERIIPLDFKTAKEWGAENLTKNKFEEVFGKIVEDETKVQKMFTISRTTEDRILRLAAEDGVMISKVLEKLAKEEIERREKQAENESEKK